jgi:hypothetical protein
VLRSFEFCSSSIAGLDEDPGAKILIFIGRWVKQSLEVNGGFLAGKKIGWKNLPGNMDKSSKY